MSERLRAAQSLFKAVIALDDGEPATLLARAAPADLDARDRAVLAATDPRRLAIYRKLVRSTLREAVRLELSRTAARLGERFDGEIAAYCRTELPRSPLLRDVAFELAVWAAPRWAADATLPPWLGDLARYELFQFDVHAARRVLPEAGRGVPCAGELGADLAVSFDGSVRLARFDHAVHELPDDDDDRTEPRAERTYLLGYRDPQNEYQELVLTPLAFRILEKLAAQGPLAAAIRRACEELGEPLGSSVVEGASRVLADLADRGMVLGASALQASPEPASPWADWLRYAASTDGAETPPAPVLAPQ